MLNVIQIPTGMVQGNCYIVGDKDNCYIIDPGDEGKRIINYVEKHYKSVKAILLTHGHFDHCGAVDDVAKYFNCDVYMDLKDMMFISTPNKKSETIIFGIDQFIETPIKDINSFVDENVTVLATPGHSPGSVTFLFKDINAAFTGDCLFKFDIGRIDLPGGDFHEMSKSLKLLATLPDNYTIYPGHEMSGTMEQMGHGLNPYISRYR